VNQTAIPPNKEIALGNYDDGDISIVEPSGVEPLTHAVQSQIHNVVIVRRCSKTLANKHILSSRSSCLFADVRVGWCTTGVQDVRVIGHVILLPGLGITRGIRPSLETSLQYCDNNEAVSNP
jgi:hypothetical protein